ETSAKRSITSSQNRRRVETKRPASSGPFDNGWGRGIRTPTGGVRVRSPTFRRSPRRNGFSGIETLRVSALGVLRRFTRLAQTDLLALDLARVAGDVTSSAQRAAHVLVIVDQRAAESVT